MPMLVRLYFRVQCGAQVQCNPVFCLLCVEAVIGLMAGMFALIMRVYFDVYEGGTKEDLVQMKWCLVCKICTL
jgi:hypothetical protein